MRPMRRREASGPSHFAVGADRARASRRSASTSAFTKTIPFQPPLRDPGRVPRPPTASSELAGADRRRQGRQGHRGRAEHRATRRARPTMPIERQRAADPRGRDGQDPAAASSSRATSSSTSSPARRARRELDDGDDDPGPADARRRCSSTRCSPRSTADTRSDLADRAASSTAARLHGGAKAFNSSLPLRRAGLQVHRDRRRGAARHAGPHDLSDYVRDAGHGRARPRPRPRRSCRTLIADFNATAARSRAEEPRSTPRVARAAAHADGRAARRSRAQRRVPAAAALRRRRCARRVRDLGPAARRARCRSSRQLRGLVRPNELRGLARDLRASPRRPRARSTRDRRAARRAGAPASSCLQHDVLIPWSQRHGRPTRTSRRPARSTRSARSRSPASPARAAPSTPTARGSSSLGTGGNDDRTSRRRPQSSPRSSPIGGVNPPPPGARPPLRPTSRARRRSAPDLRSTAAPAPAADRDRPRRSAASRALDGAGAQQVAVDWLRQQVTREAPRRDAEGDRRRRSAAASRRASGRSVSAHHPAILRATSPASSRWWRSSSSRWRVGVYILHHAAPALPVHRDQAGLQLNAEFSTAQAVTPGPGPDRRGSRACGSATSPSVKLATAARSWRSTSSRSTSDLIHRDATGAAAPAHRPEGHVHRARPRARTARRRPRRAATIPVSSTTLPDVNLDEILAALDTRHARLPEAAGQRRRRGARRPRRRPRRAAPALRADPPRPRARVSHAVAAARTRTCAGSSRRSRSSTARWPPGDDDLARLVRTRARCSRAFASEDAQRRRDASASCPPRCARRPARSRGRSRSRDALGPTTASLRPPSAR